MDKKLLDILRCPVCKGVLHYDKAARELICRGDRLAYPIRDDIPVMLIEEGDRFRNVPRAELPEVPPPEAPALVTEASSAPEGLADEQALILALAGLLVGVGLVLLLIRRSKKKRSE